MSILSQAERSSCVEAGITNGFLHVPDSTAPSPLSYHVNSVQVSTGPDHVICPSPSLELHASPLSNMDANKCPIQAE